MVKLYDYINGDVSVTIYSDGTKIRRIKQIPYKLEHPESIDCKITNWCDAGCSYCHEMSTTSGKHGDLELLKEKLKNLPAGVELACLSGDTVVYSENGIVEIKDLKVGDFIYDSNHNLVEVKNIKISEKDKILIKGNKGFAANCSKDHPFMSNGTQILAENMIGKKLDLLECKSSFNENVDLKLDLSKYVTIANPNKRGSRGGVILEDKIKLNSVCPFIPRYITLDKELMWMYGLVVAEGSKKSIVLNINEKDYAARFIAKYKDLFNLESSIYLNENKNSQTIEPKMPKVFQSLFFEEMEIGYGARNKSLSFLFKIDNKEYIRSAFNGLFDGDGCYRKRKDKHKSFSLSYKTSSKKLAYEMTYLLKKYFDVTATLYHGINKERKIEGRVLKPSDYYKIDIYSKDDILKLFPDVFKDDDDFNNVGNYKYSTTSGTKNDTIVDKIEELGIKENLYDITLSDESTHIFPINGYFLTHNCGGGNPLAHPDLVDFLQWCKDRGLIANMTVNQLHLKESLNDLKYYLENDLIKGLGISIMNHHYNEIKELKKLSNNIVYHLIAGIHKINKIDELIELGGCKVLILGYKQIGRGINHYSQRVESLIGDWKSKIQDYFTKCVVSFDNLSIDQLDIQSKVSPEVWERSYMGDDFTHTMYIDAVREEFGPTSTSSYDYRVSFKDDDLFNYFQTNRIINE